MKIVQTTSGLAELTRVEKGCVLTIGNFDGVHLGHQKILATARQTAAERKAELIVMTFEPHPRALLYPQKALGILTPLVLKKHLLAELGVDYFCIVKSTLGLLNLSPRQFVQHFIAEKIQPSVVIEGRSFNFGSDRAGNVNVLQNLAREMGFEVLVIEAKKVKSSTGQVVNVSSTAIRSMLAAGRVVDAAVALGRPYRLIGQVVPGRGRGRQLGFPTANMQPTEQLIPAEGVYAGFVEIGDTAEQVCKTHKKLPAAFSIIRPGTPGCGYSLAVEAHLLMEDVGRLQGKWLAMDFVKRIRDQQRFKTDSELSAQIAKDCKKAKNILATD
ncbi:MAG: bifunctional riboflavin kinase/FAD synthetase [Sedimentisphaerales bacterium]